MRYEAYKTATTVQEALELGATKGDIEWDIEHGFVTLGERKVTRV
jgi:hypothetical protein